MRCACITLPTSLIVILCRSGHGAVTTFENRAAWQAAVGDHTNITFQGFPIGTLITNQYAGLGVLFTDNHDFIRAHSSFLNDGVGLGSTDLIYGTIHMSFAQPITAIATDFLGDIDIQLYSSGLLIYSSPTFSDVSGPFAGLISTLAFDAAVIRDPGDGSVNIDDLYFGPPVPAPIAAALLAIALVVRQRRRL